MKCDQVQALIPRYLTKELPNGQAHTVADHLADCAECRSALAFHRGLESTLDAIVAPPDQLRSLVIDKVERDQRPALLARLLGDSTMKKIVISSTLVTALAAGVLLSVPRSATASTPEETLKTMRAALAKAAKNGELSFNLTANQDGTVTVNGTLDGKSLPPDFPLDVQVSREGEIFDVRVSVDFAPESYTSIKFGKNANTIMVVPKKEPNEKYQIELDPKSKKPKAWTTWAYQNGQWTTSRFNLNPKPSAPPTKDDDQLINVRVKIQLGGTATITSKPG